MRVYELAKELGIESKDALERLQGLGVDVSSNFQAVDPDDAERLKASLGDKKAPAKKATKKKAAKKTTKKKAAAKKTTKKKAAKKKETKKKATKKKAAKKVTKKKAAKKVTKKKAAAKAPAAEKAAKKAPAVTRKAPEKAPAAAAEAATKSPVVKAPEEAPAPKAAPEPAPARERKPAPEVSRPPVEPFVIKDGMTVKDLAEKMGVKPADVMRELMMRGTMANINQSLSGELAVAMAEVFGAEARYMEADEVLLADIEESRPEDLVPRPPVVTIMGHVDHGKTLLLDSIRETNVVDKEAGGITQHIGASSVVHDGQKIVFIDTPGHEAFTRMRARGAEVTDIVVLVVAADDGVMPQTAEAIDHARAAGVPIIVAINKIDRPDANVDRVKQQLGERNLAPEDWGGDTVTVEVSAKMKQNLDSLLEMIGLTAELLELRASPVVPASGTVLEAKLDRQRGPVATLLVQEGTLRVGDSLIIGMESGKVRAMVNEQGENVDEAGPATAVEVLGLAGVPEAGDSFQEVEATGVARKVSEIRQERKRQANMTEGTRLTLEDLHEQLRAGEVREMPVVVKADVQGSVEVLRDAMQKLSTDKVKIEILRAGAGGITESDVLLASASNAIIVGFNVRPERGVANAAEREGIEIRLYTIIYQLLDDLKQAMLGQLEPEFKESRLGSAEVRDTFRIPRVGVVAGCYMTDGKITRDAKVRLLRDSRVIFEGRVGSLRRFKEDVAEVQQGYECGIGIANFNDVKVGDVIEAFQVEQIAAKL
jgi:translation initiation factor IF-2